MVNSSLKKHELLTINYQLLTDDTEKTDFVAFTFNYK